MGDFFDDTAQTVLVGDHWAFEGIPAERVDAAVTTIRRLATDTADALLLINILGLTEAS